MEQLAIGEGTRLVKEPSALLGRHLYGPMSQPDDLVFQSLSRINRAHVVMLAERGIVSEAIAAEILGVLVELDGLGFDALPTDHRHGEVFTHVEQYVMNHAGAGVGGNLHVGRSRADLYVSTYRLYVRERLLDLAQALVALRTQLVALARDHVHSIMPSYTHLQHAQTITFGHYLTGVLGAFARDTDRVFDAFGRVNQSSLGTAVGAGSSWPLDRDRVAELLAFNSFVPGAFDAVTSQDHLVEAAAVAACVTANHLTLVLDLYMWTAYEFGFIEIGDEFCGSSSLMPQKKNPMGLETIRSRSSRVYGDLVEVLTTHKAENVMERAIFGFQPVQRSLETTIDMLDFETAIVPTIVVNVPRMRQLSEDGFTGASELANCLTRSAGLSFRESHRVVGTLVRLALERGIHPGAVDSGLVREAGAMVLEREVVIDDAAVKAAMRPSALIEGLVTPGSANPVHVDKTLRLLGEGVAMHDERERSERKRLTDADEQLGAAVAALVAGGT